MPLTEKGAKIKSNMEQEYGPKKGESVFYASVNKGTITGVHNDRSNKMSKDVSNITPASGPMNTDGPNGTSEGLPKTVEPFSQTDAPRKSDCAMSMDDIKAMGKRIGKY